jgi:hypothetical protein
MRIICHDECRPEKRPRSNSGWSVITGLLLLMMPKCALCWAAYMSVLGSFGIVIRYQPWVLPVLIILYLLTLTKLLIGSLRTGSFLAFGMAVVAAALTFSQISVQETTHLKFMAIGLMVGSIVVNQLAARRTARAKNLG